MYYGISGLKVMLNYTAVRTMVVHNGMVVGQSCYVI